MKTNLLRRFLLFLALASSFIPSASGFVSSTFLGAITPEESHAALTKTAIQLAYDDQGVTKTTKSMKIARTPTGSIEQCGQILRRVSDESKQVKRVRKTLKKNLHFRPLGDGHMILRPGWYADYDDMVAAHSAMSEDDIPVLVSLIGREKLKDGMLSIGIGVLQIFGEKALPCIEAGMSIEEWDFVLPSIKSGIKASIKYPDPHATVPSQNPITRVSKPQKEVSRNENKFA